MMRLVRWGTLGLLILGGTSIAAYLILVGPRVPPSAFYPFPFFPLIFGIFVLFWVIRWALWPWGGGYGWGYWGGDQAHQILGERYARGEITKDQFEQMTRDLERHE
jgi:uncharacterized membrane protein